MKKQPIEYEIPCSICGNDVTVFQVPNYSRDPQDQRDCDSQTCEKCTWKENFDATKLSGVKMADVDGKDYPDFVDAYIEDGEYDGETLEDWQIDYIQEMHSDYCQEKALEQYLGI